MFGILDAATA